jgi:hypothetical protein
VGTQRLFIAGNWSFSLPPTHRFSFAPAKIISSLMKLPPRP